MNQQTASSLDVLTHKIERVVMPEIWDSVGGVSTIRPYPEKTCLIVSTNDYVHEQIRTFLKEMRAKRLAMNDPGA